jgi:hypothetical protein
MANNFSVVFPDNDSKLVQISLIALVCFVAYWFGWMGRQQLKPNEESCGVRLTRSSLSGGYLSKYADLCAILQTLIRGYAIATRQAHTPLNLIGIDLESIFD